MLNKDGSTPWEDAGGASTEYENIPFVPAIPVPETQETCVPPRDVETTFPLISLPASSVVSEEQGNAAAAAAASVAALPPNENPKYKDWLEEEQVEGEAKSFDNSSNYSVGEQEVPYRELKREWRDLKRQAKKEWKQLKRCAKYEAKVHQRLLKEEQHAMKQQWKCQKRAWKQASRHCGQGFQEEARLWRGFMREEGCAMRDSFRQMRQDSKASLDIAKQELLNDLSRSFRDFCRC